jgi:probable O-glycosylation ligase (exosortase A-associated)
VLLILAVSLVSFMPDSWSDRMNTIKTFEQDASAMGRISAWWNAWGIGLHYFAGVGFNPARPELFARFSPYPDTFLAAHSIYFQIMGNHGFIGLFLFLGIWISSWRMAGWLRNQKNLSPEIQWTVDLGAMCQVCLMGYAVGGAFLSLSYFDLPYNVMAIVVLTRVWIEKKSWLTEPVYLPGWRTIPGLASPAVTGQAT